MQDAARFLGFAFANADLLLEVDKMGKVSFAVGAATEFGGDDKMTGSALGRLFEPSESAKLSTHLHALGPGGRSGPLRLRLAGGTQTHVSLFRLPENGGRISCTLSHMGKRRSMGGEEQDPQTGLANRDSFMSALPDTVDENDELSLIEVPELSKACESLPPQDADKLMQLIGQSLKAGDTKAAGRIGASKFGAIGPNAGSVREAGTRIREVLQAGGFAATDVQAELVSLKGQNLSDEQRVLAVRYVLGQFASGNLQDAAAEDISTIFEAMLNDTQSRAKALTETVADGNFTLQFQPLFDLKTGTVTHYESLSRFKDMPNTSEMIQFAEQLGIANMFDLAVVIKIHELVSATGTSGPVVALNLSGSTISSPAAFSLVAGLLARERKHAKQILIEITETSEIANLDEANLAVQTLRELGYRVGLDDFGAGAASLNYLHAFTVDFVKFDIALVKKLGTSARDDALVGGLIKLCGELGVETIAEGIENAQILTLVKSAGFDLGQGFHLGKPVDALPEPVHAHSSVGKRRGASESWG